LFYQELSKGGYVAQNHDFTLDPFVTRIWGFDLGQLDQYKEAWRHEVRKMMHDSPEPAGRSNRQGWNSANSLFLDHPIFRPLRLECQQAFLKALSDLQAPRDTQFMLQAWINVTHPGGYNVQHGHPRSYLSGAYYLDVPENSGRICFADPRTGAKHSMLKADGLLSSNTLRLQPKEGQLLIFPAWLEHYVELNESSLQRTSIAMNAVHVVRSKS
jgi:uncharacterized protein (TIGR02466 family)